MSSTTPQYVAPAEAPRDIPTIQSQETSSPLPSWNATTAYRLGTLLYTRLTPFPQPTVIHISTISSPPHVLFHAAVQPGTTLDNDYWVARKRNAVIRWGASTWRLHNQFEGDEEKFAKKLGLGEKAGEYAIHGGGVPVYVKGVEGPVAVAVVSGLKQWDDHMVVVEELARLRGELEGES
ncbi:hypothetical protein B0J11DRAFT_514833 [Dendryphion nanum]|uniref:DUF967 domain protein n=1 Tax=Dendryphion nanum TaxID=256645 RepID=A0A9P9EJF8_9PLEO|nr:hypothetical protein B0J11DRAFT_514833 [Dendryphion nanum]